MASTIWIWLPLCTKRKVTRFYDVKHDLKILSKICGLHIRKNSFRLWSLPAVLRSICKQELPDIRLTISSSIALVLSRVCYVWGSSCLGFEKFICEMSIGWIINLWKEYWANYVKGQICTFQLWNLSKVDLQVLDWVKSFWVKHDGRIT